MAAATNSKVRSVVKLLETIADLHGIIEAQRKATQIGAAKRDALKAGEEGVKDIQFDIPQYRPSGFAGITAEGAMGPVLDTLLQSSTGIPDFNFSTIIDTIGRLEAIALQNTGNLRKLAAEVRAATPRQAIAVATPGLIETSDTDDMPEAIISMRRASDIFTEIFNDPIRGSSVLLDFDVPIIEFDREHPDVPKIDPTFRFHSGVLAEILDCLVENEIAWLHGKSGCGKSEIWMQIAARLGWPLLRLNMDSHLTRADLIGTNRLVPGPTGAPVMKFIEGLVPRALRMPSIMLIDEMDLGDPEVMPVLQPVLEGRGVRILEDGGRYVDAHPYSRIGITANTIGLGSENQVYLNAHEQSGATRDRVSRFIPMPFLPADEEAKVVLSRIPTADPEFVKKVVTIANLAREAYSQNKISTVISTRTVTRAARRHANFIGRFPNEDDVIITSLDVTVLNRCDNNSRAVVKGFIDATFA